jgi:trans-2,3-dihydro-3-hydroxyanthranilate isomerase
VALIVRPHEGGTVRRSQKLAPFEHLASPVELLRDRDAVAKEGLELATFDELECILKKNHNGLTALERTRLLTGCAMTDPSTSAVGRCPPEPAEGAGTEERAIGPAAALVGSSLIFHPRSGSMRSFSFVTLDVFSDRPLEGNPLAVFPDAAALNASEMQAIAREFNLSETTFVLRRDAETERTRGIRTRIFSATKEMQFAGHPTLGTAFVLRGATTVDELALELNVGRIPVRFSGTGPSVFGEMTQKDPTFGARHAPEGVAAALGVEVNDLDARYPIETVSTGTPFAIVPFRSLERLRHWKPSWNSIATYIGSSDAMYLYAVCTETANPGAGLHARLPFEGGEDPATGSAAGPAVAWMVRHGIARPDEPVLIEQGLEVGRPSRIYAKASLEGSHVVRVRVGGHVVRMSQGFLSLG